MGVRFLVGVKRYFIAFEVLTAVFMKSSIFWDITPCSPLEVNRRFEGTYHIYIFLASQNKPRKIPE
jgi:hypothetical protein